MRRRCSLPALPDKIFAHSPFPRTQTSLQLAELQPTNTFLSSLSTSSQSTTPSHIRFVRRRDCITLSQQPFGVSGLLPQRRQSACLPAGSALAPAADTCAFSQQQQGIRTSLRHPPQLLQHKHRRISRLCSASRPVTLIAAVAVVWATKRLPPSTDARFRRQDNNSSARSLNQHCTTQTEPVCRPRRTDGLHHMVPSRIVCTHSVAPLSKTARIVQGLLAAPQSISQDHSADLRSCTVISNSTTTTHHGPPAAGL